MAPAVAVLLLVSCFLPSLAVPTVNFVSTTGNDLWQLLAFSQQPFVMRLYGDLDSAIANSHSGDVVIVTAEV
jgi:hypothetical protein